MSTATIRKARPEDLPAAMALLERWTMAPRPPDAHHPDPERSGLDLARTFIAEEDGRLVGVASWIRHSDRRGETASLAVDPELRGQGIGYRLQAARLEEMRTAGIRVVRTETDRPATIRWYIEKFGYRKVGQNPKKHAFSLAGVDTWTVLELEL